ncbi:MAG: outer membrane beta-barrel protein, partial [Candidatus Eremiobacteraeota bacterium]|nr:outer membrane beta-barrel protein [Candidatus Eremiobacteraeota bacterium]
EPDVTVTSRIRSDYDTGGIRAGGYVVRPRLNESFGYESNVLGRSQASGSSLVSTNAAIDAMSDNSRGNVSVGASVDDTRYLDLPNQSFTNWNARIGGTYNLGRDSASVLLTHDNLNQTQRDLDVPQLSAPLAFVIDTFRAGYRAVFSRLSLVPSLEVARLSYNSGFSGTTIYDQSYRNRVVLTPGITAAYEFATRRSIVFVVRNTTAFYSRGTAVNPKRDFNDTSVLGGLDYDLNGSFRVRALVGYESRTFSSNTFPTIQAPIAELTLIYNPTPLTTVSGTLARRIQDSADETTAGATNLSARLRIDHELRRNVIISATGAVVRNQYASGSQVQYIGGVSGSYLLNRYAAVGASYDVSARNSSGSNILNLNGFPVGNDYVDHRILLQLKLSL